MDAPVNVKIKDPSISISGWTTESRQWMEINKEANGNENFYPLTIKAAYVIGIIHDICQSVSHLLKHKYAKQTTYIPAYGVFSSGVEILGRCINGNHSLIGAVNDLKTGFKWLESNNIDNIPDDFELIETNISKYTIDQLTFFRHFAAHGQATANDITSIDFGILAQLKTPLANGLERYWKALMEDEDLCNSLAKANVLPLRGWPVYKSWILFEKDKDGIYHSVEDIFNRFDWKVA